MTLRKSLRPPSPTEGERRDWRALRSLLRSTGSGPVNTCGGLPGVEGCFRDSGAQTANTVIPEPFQGPEAAPGSGAPGYGTLDSSLNILALSYLCVPHG